MLNILNYIAVCVYGCVLAAAFCGMGETAKSRWTVAGIAAAMLAVQAFCYSILDVEAIRTFYPLITHLPLVLCLWGFNKKLRWSFVSVLIAYLCCQLRRWMGLLLAAPLGSGNMALNVVELALTIPLLALLLRFVAPQVSRLAERPSSNQGVLLFIPLIYYIFDYVAIVYTDLLYSGVAAAVEFMPFVCCGAYLYFLLYTADREHQRSKLETDRKILNLQMAQSIRELSSLRESQQQAAVYRHDLRHHLQYISALIQNDETQQAQNYIMGICDDVAAQKVVSYCENEGFNLILSAYVARAAKAGVAMDINVTLSVMTGVTSGDLCVLLGNAMENALNACAKLSGEERRIDVQGYERGGKLFLQITNPCADEIRFEDGLPVAKKEGHGQGSRSIAAIVKRYGGLCSFSLKNGMFILRIAL